MTDLLKREFFECSCHSMEHTVAFTMEHYPDEAIAELSLEVQLIQWKPWYRRVWPAVKYLFNIKASSGHWDSWLLHYNDVDRLAQMVNYIKDAKDGYIE